MRFVMLALFLMPMMAHAGLVYEEDLPEDDVQVETQDAEMDDRVEERLQLREDFREHRRPRVTQEDDDVQVELSPKERPQRKHRRAAYRIQIEGFSVEGDEL